MLKRLHRIARSHHLDKGRALHGAAIAVLGFNVGDSLALSGHSSSPGERKMSAIFSELWLEERLCDVVISVGGVEFNAHKNVLCNCSPYFRALFSTSWSNAGKVVYKIPGTSPEMMRLIIEYAYSGTAPVTADNVEDLLIAADQFNVMGVIRLCCEFLKSQLCLENCVGIWRFTEHYYCPDLREAAHAFILHHLEEMTMVSTEFLELSVNELQHVLQKEELRGKEAAVFEAILKWIAHDPQNRGQHIGVLLGQEEWKGRRKGFI